ncbi:MAG: winged helix DNA-binding domain-containing protein [Solirubrobacteraceae bacterium]|nr:winged helix DNA-binding domain-containing protein [Solirubrobacteraceae bacterium]
MPGGDRRIPREDVLSRAEARRVALAAQGFADRHHRRPPARVTAAHLDRVVDRIGLLQIDSVNVLARAHRLPLYSRIGPYDDALLERATARRPRRLVEYWAHEASLVPPATHRLLRWRMARVHDEAWGTIRRAGDDPALLDAVEALVAAHGPVTAAALERLLRDAGADGPATPHAGPAGRAALAAVLAAARHDHDYGWRWTALKQTLEHLFFVGRVTSAGRTAQFERRYDLPERVLPPDIHAAPDPDPADARRDLVRIAARAHGVASGPCLRDYFRLGAAQARPAIADLVDAGELRPVRVEGWDRDAYLHRDARIPRRVDARALLAPFDPLIFERTRTEALFGMRYRLEIYVPAARRVHGYYVLPFLRGERLVARVDLKAERVGAGRLLVRAAHAEPDAAHADVAPDLAVELRRMAGWLGLDAVDVEPRGDLADALARAVAGSPA